MGRRGKRDHASLEGCCDGRDAGRRYPGHRHLEPPGQRRGAEAWSCSKRRTRKCCFFAFRAFVDISVACRFVAVVVVAVIKLTGLACWCCGGGNSSSSGKERRTLVLLAGAVMLVLWEGEADSKAVWKVAA